MDFETERPTHAYIGRKPCGCVMAVASDTGEASMFQFLADAVEGGLKFEHVTWDRYHEVCNEPTFMACNHGQLKFKFSSANESV